MKKYFTNPPKASLKVKLTELGKKNIKDDFQPLVESFKKQCILKNPNKEFNYLIDIYSKWYQNYFYLCEKYKSEHSNRLADEFEVKIIRLKYTGKNLFDFSYFRHTGQWHLLAKGLTLDDCKEMILSNPVFQPISA